MIFNDLGRKIMDVHLLPNRNILMLIQVLGMKNYLINEVYNFSAIQMFRSHMEVLFIMVQSSQGIISCLELKKW